jgi:hypothetical protein
MLFISLYKITKYLTYMCTYKLTSYFCSERELQAACQPLQGPSTAAYRQQIVHRYLHHTPDIHLYSASSLQDISIVFVCMLN